MSELNYLEKLLDGVEVEWSNLGNLCDIFTGGEAPQKHIKGDTPTSDYQYPIYGNGAEIYGYADSYRIGQDAVTISSIGANTGTIYFRKAFFTPIIRLKVVIPKHSWLLPRYLFHYLSSQTINSKSSSVPNMNASDVKKLSIPIPCPNNPEKSLAIQSEIVRILDKFTALTAELTAELTARKKQYNYYRDQLLSFDEEQEKPIYLEKLLDGVEVEWRNLGDTSLFEIANNGRKPVKASLRIAGETPYYGANNIQDYVDGYTHDGEYVLIAEDGSASLENYSIQYATGKFWANNHVHVVRVKERVHSRFLYHYLCIVNFLPFLTGGGRAKLTKGQLIEIPVPIPCPDNPEKSLAIQSEIVRILDKFDTLTNSITEGLPREIELRQKQYEYYRDLLFSFPKPDSVTN
ncbi:MULTISPECIES: restriction endonuclease subunit S [Klebsiella pneumoniae complex]|uniref:restriction endonuclease subunit S n=1 Tax=Klebsiella pneumoniae complex TaxID=3390273 RepID=UPI0008FAF65B|nr:MULTISPECIES: restriction endonuclease subunit S [Klebsiella]MBC4754582.1 restriction endonuclease subunit S [Klebsiella variicola]OKN04055.1 type I restriction-modification methylasetype I restriction enzyme, S subunit [Klebsiella pneumoniae]ROD90117.1 restriction endonuclease subunit S [Klebsiella pneumoniae subsp. pneumoniae]HBY5717513.1 restriction endonuclease subunit S [Klebsiella pneumoniae]HDT6563454.1 restriction endonuclease subunit S [Klebsiella pneumoniae]